MEKVEILQLLSRKDEEVEELRKEVWSKKNEGIIAQVCSPFFFFLRWLTLPSKEWASAHIEQLQTELDSLYERWQSSQEQLNATTVEQQSLEMERDKLRGKSPNQLYLAILSEFSASFRWLRTIFVGSE